jgi:hypothetical protein
MDHHKEVISVATNSNITSEQSQINQSSLSLNLIATLEGFNVLFFKKFFNKSEC